MRKEQLPTASVLTEALKLISQNLVFADLTADELAAVGAALENLKKNRDEFRLNILQAPFWQKELYEFRQLLVRAQKESFENGSIDGPELHEQLLLLQQLAKKLLDFPKFSEQYGDNSILVGSRLRAIYSGAQKTGKALRNYELKLITSDWAESERQFVSTQITVLLISIDDLLDSVGFSQ